MAKREKSIGVCKTCDLWVEVAWSGEDTPVCADCGSTAVIVLDARPDPEGRTD